MQEVRSNMNKSSKKYKKTTKTIQEESDDIESANEDKKVASIYLMDHSDKDDEQNDKVTLKSLSYNELQS